MRIKGQTAKLHDAEMTAGQHHQVATYGDLRRDVVDLVADLDMHVFANFDESHPNKVIEAVGRELVIGKGIRRAAVVNLLKRIAARDAGFFSDMAKLFSIPDSETVAASPMWAELSEIRFLQECGLIEPLTQREVMDRLSTSPERTTVADAIRKIGVLTRPDKKGRPKISPARLSPGKGKQSKKPEAVNAASKHQP